MSKEDYTARYRELLMACIPIEVIEAWKGCIIYMKPDELHALSIDYVVRIQEDRDRWKRRAEAAEAEVERLNEAWVDEEMRKDRDLLLEQVEKLKQQNLLLLEELTVAKSWARYD